VGLIGLVDGVTLSAYQAALNANTSAISELNNAKKTLKTLVNTTSGTSIDFTGIPSTTKKITAMFNGVSTNGSSIVQIQLGSGTVQTSGYASRVASTNLTTGVPLNGTTSTVARNSTVVFVNINGNTWIAYGTSDNNSSAESITGIVSLSGTLDIIRITTVNGTDTFDAGSVNIMYEG